ncbi:hypothetical protein PIN31115_02770 [Pandoraea iniqua]|uniref:Uncharacterized protein n=1 Tax=Pandoraea iniqua TaxID=2508288 RepID=A0A5E4VS44_9BURK|nr:hypothetical protein PIN31115_02770 [Pandoraea iniqua]
MTGWIGCRFIRRFTPPGHSKSRRFRCNEGGGFVVSGGVIQFA